MYKVLKIFFLCLTSIGVLHSQGGWKKRLFLQNSFVSTSQNIFETPNNNFICVGLTTDTINGSFVNKLTLTGLNNAGVLIWRKDYGNPKFEYLFNYFAKSAAIFKDSNSFYFTGLVRDSAIREFGVLIKFNFNGDTLWQKIYRDSLEDVIPQGITKSVDGGFLITGWFQNWINNTNTNMILKTDANGNELWRKKIHKAVPDFHYGNGILQDSATKKIIITGTQYIGSATYQSAYSNVLITDSLGNKISQSALNNAGAGGFLDVIQLKDGNFLSCGAWTNHSNTTANFVKGYVVKFDINANIIWSKTFFEPTLMSAVNYLTELDNEDIVATGQSQIEVLQNKPYSLKLMLLKLDKNGNTKKISPIGNSLSYIDESANSLNKTSDGGFIIATQFPNMRNPTPYSVIKVDSTFCDTSAQWCESVALPVTNFNKLTGYNFEMYPNPANEIINFRIDAPSEKTISIIINDLSAKQIEKLEIEANTDLQLNTSNYQAGIYFVSILINSTAIETKKLVIVR